MSTIYSATPGVHVGPAPCAECGAARRLHAADGTCPEPYRETRLDVAQRALSEAIAAGDSEREFIARGDVQRLTPR